MSVANLLSLIGVYTTIVMQLYLYFYLFLFLYNVSTLPLSHTIPLAPFISIINGKIIVYLSNKCHYRKN